MNFKHRDNKPCIGEGFGLRSGGEDGVAGCRDIAERGTVCNGVLCDCREWLLLLLLLTELHATLLPASYAIGPEMIAGVEGSEEDLKVAEEAEGGGEDDCNGVKIFLKTNSRDINAASIPAQSLSALLLQLLILPGADELKFP
jgi:hypothetical protein